MSGIDMDWKKAIETREIGIAVYGLGYVGLPTALGFADMGFKVVGVDVGKELVDRLNLGESHIDELGIDEILKRAVKRGKFRATTDGVAAAKESDVMIICVPTPVNEAKKPDLTAVLSAGEAISRGLKKDSLVILESTVHPTCTENELKPILEFSGFKAGVDFGLAYVPERYNPGDPEHTVERVVRVAGAINREWLDVTASLYSLITKEVYTVKDIKTAEAAKIIENIQRDLNIALMNELALIFERLGVDVFEVLDAAATKWNFVKYRPGAGVGGHCLPVDPYYLTFKAQELGFHSQVILAGRGVNDSMPYHVVDLVVRGLNDLKKAVKDSKIAVLGLSYKKNTGDVRNTPSKTIIEELAKLGASVTAYDPFVSVEETSRLGAVYEEPNAIFRRCSCIVLATDHDVYREIDLKAIRNITEDRCVVVDGGGFYETEAVKQAGFDYLGVGRGG